MKGKLWNKGARERKIIFLLSVTLSTEDKSVTPPSVTPLLSLSLKMEPLRQLRGIQASPVSDIFSRAT